MNRFATVVLIAWATAGRCFSGSSADAAEIEYASAVMGAAGVPGGQTVSANQFVAWRFEIDENTLVNEVGGHLAQIKAGSLFAALVKLDAVDSLPAAPPFDGGKLVASTTFAAPTTSADVHVPLTAPLAPGAYALVFGAGLFGPAGETTTWSTGFMPQPATQTLVEPTTASSFLLWIGGTTQQWRTNIGSNLRFVVRGAPYAGPGDFNGDGAINGSDLSVWRSHFGGAGSMTVADGDANGDGAVGGVDFLTWQRGQGQPAATVGAVPEPSSGWVALAIVGMIQLRRSRRRP